MSTAQQVNFTACICIYTKTSKTKDNTLLNDYEGTNKIRCTQTLMKKKKIYMKAINIYNCMEQTNIYL